MCKSNQCVLSGLVFSAVICVASTTQAVLVGHWALDEPGWSGSPGEVTDSSSTNNHGQRVGDATTVAGGRIGRAGTFDGSGDYVTIPDNATHDLQSDATISVWAQFDAVPAGTHTVVGASTYSDGFLFNQIGDRLSVYYRSGGPSISTPVGSLSTGTWYHMALTNTSGAMNLYLNGVLMGSPSEGANTFISRPWQIGGGQFPSIDGNVDDFAVWDEGVDLAKARSLYTVVEDLALQYDAGHLNALWQIYDGESSGTVDGTNWVYTSVLPGTPGLGDAYVDGQFRYIALGADSGVFSMIPVPEPSSVTLLGLGLLVLVRNTRRRRRAQV